VACGTGLATENPERIARPATARERQYEALRVQTLIALLPKPISSNSRVEAQNSSGKNSATLTWKIKTRGNLSLHARSAASASSLEEAGRTFIAKIETTNRNSISKILIAQRWLTATDAAAHTAAVRPTNLSVDRRGVRRNRAPEVCQPNPLSLLERTSSGIGHAGGTV
jgi:hypothetical protein